MRGPQDEERGISTPRVSQEKPPSPSLPRKRGGQAPAFSRESPGLWPAADPAVPPGRPAHPLDSRRGPSRRGPGRREQPGSQGLMGPHSEGRGGGGKRVPEPGASSGIVNS